MSFYKRLHKAFFSKKASEPGFFPDAPLAEFTPQFRLEVHSRMIEEETYAELDKSDSLAMRIADPLWLLGRQWQFGEFVGEDNGSPVRAKSYYRKEKVDALSTKGSEKQILNGVPVEAMVESMEIAPLDLKSRVRIGQQYEQLIRDYFGKANQIEEGEELIKKLRVSFP